MNWENKCNRVAFMPEKKINLVFGFEFNRTSQFKKKIYEGRFANSTVITYKINSLSIPLNASLNFGYKTKIIFEAGGVI